MAADGGAAQARLRWELENQIGPAPDAELYRWDPAEQQALQQQRPWARDPHYFKHVRISALALLKMAMHARSGGALEVMGLLQGRAQGDTFVVLDCFALPVEGTETRVNAQAEAYEYMVAFVDAARRAGRGDNVVGWYHSHPGYGCWLSGIDVGTQMLNQTYQEPWLAVVVDPVRTMASGKVELGAFRTFPEGYSAPASSGGGGADPDAEYQTIPLSKIEDFGVHARAYYPLEVSYFKSALDGALVDLLWKTHWATALAQSPLVAGRAFAAGQIADVAEKLAAAEGHAAGGAARARYAAALGGKGGGGKGGGGDGGGGEAVAGGGGGGAGAGAGGPLDKICRDATRLSAEQIKGLASQAVKQLLFNMPPARLLGAGGQAGRAAGAAAAAAAGAGGGGGGAAAAAGGGGAAMES